MPRHPLVHRLAATAAGATLALTLAACAGPAASPGGGTDEPTGTVSTASDVHNDADTWFLQAMIVHHEGAIEMSELAEREATTPQVRELAQDIAAAQGPEIDLMTGWLEAWGEDTDWSMPGMDHDGMDMDGMRMHGMSQGEAMSDLDDLTGPSLDRRFLELMVAHHEGAVMMSEQELDDGANPDALGLASTIVTDQRAEIALMRRLLDEL
ncbi:DUF305 domain-containing protein [Cellulomonas soli]|uniref:DUF305 domain-containing protein n=1 Tax=Cellulomonas soli TaxID=931535 RepID=UPI003F87DCF2